MTAFTKRMPAFLETAQTLSLDVVLGAMAVGYFSCRLLDVSPNAVWWLILPSAVWSFYTFDHLIDGFKSRGRTNILRHRFHYKHKKILFILAVLFGITALVFSLVFLEFKIIKWGLLIGSLVLFYFSALFFWGKRKILLLQKEMVIAFVYVFGIWLAPLVWSGGFPYTFILSVITILLLLAWAEGIMASWFDFENDSADGHSSFTVLFGKQFTRRFLIVLHILIFLLIKLSIFFISTNLQFAALMILAIMNLSLLLILLYPNWFRNNNRYRIYGEAVFWLPALLIFL